MSKTFDPVIQARSILKLLTMAENSLEQAGGAIHTERLVDYASSELERLTMEQALEVIAELDPDFEKKLLRDGYGEVIGYAFKKHLFVMMRRDPASQDELAFAKQAKSVRKK